VKGDRGAWVFELRSFRGKDSKRGITGTFEGKLQYRVMGAKSDLSNNVPTP